MQQKVMYESFWKLSQNLERHSKTRGCARNQRIRKRRSLTDFLNTNQSQLAKRKVSAIRFPLMNSATGIPLPSAPHPPRASPRHPAAIGRNVRQGSQGTRGMGDGGGCGGTGASTPAMGRKRGEETSIGNPLARRGLSGGRRLHTDHPSLPCEARAVWGGRRSRECRRLRRIPLRPRVRQFDRDSTGEFAPRVRGGELGRIPPRADEFHGRSKGTRDTRGGGDGEEE